MDFVTFLNVYLVPFLLVALAPIAALFAKATLDEWKRRDVENKLPAVITALVHQAEYFFNAHPDVLDQLEAGANVKKADVLHHAQEYLDSRGVKLDVQVVEGMIEESVRKEFNRFQTPGLPKPPAPPAPDYGV